MKTSITAALAVAIIFAPSFAVAKSDMHRLVSAAAARAGVPDAIAHAVIRRESGYRAHVTGGGGAIGLGQIKCATAKGIGFRGACRDLYNPETNLRWSMAYLAIALRKGGGGCAGVSLYQRGVHGRPVCTAYGRAVLGRRGAF